MIASLAKARSAQPLRMSDLISFNHFVRTRTYQVVFEPRSLRHQIVIPLHLAHSRRAGLVYVLNRSSGRDFTDTELALAYALQPALVAHHAARRSPRSAPAVHTKPGLAAGLTNREIEVMSLVAAGMTAVAIGHVLRISPRTVRKHIENAYIILGTHDRLIAVTKCRRLGLLQ